MSNTRKLTCAPEPAPSCFIVDGQQVCLAAPVRCVATCDGAANQGACVIVCCAAFAPEPVPALHAVPLAVTVVLVAMLAIWARGRGLIGV